jgi:Domain of unknown function (DUF5615)
MTVSGSAMRILADENIEFEVVSLLKNLGHDVMWMVTRAPGTDDAEITGLAYRQARILVTYDVEFISAMRLSGQIHAGAVLVRGGHNDFAWTASAIHETLAGRKTWQGRIAVIKPSGIRYMPQE